MEKMTDGWILRLFGVPSDAVRQTLREMENENLRTCCAGRGGETLAAVQAVGLPHPRRAEALLQDAESTLRRRFAGAVYGSGSRILPECAAEALKKRKALLVCADAAAGALLEPRLQAVSGAEAVFDFGTQSYADPHMGPRIAESGRRSGEEAVQAACAKALAACRMAGADFAAACAQGPQAAAVVLGSRRGCWLRRVNNEENPALWLLDMIRRAAEGAEQAEGTLWLRCGAPVPESLREQPAPAEPLREEALETLLTEAEPPQEQSPAEGWKKEPHPVPHRTPEPEAAAASDDAPGTGRRLVTGTFLLLLAAGAAAAAVWLYAGGNVSTLLEWARSREFSLSGATLLGILP